LYDLPGGALPRHRPDGGTEVAHATPVADRAVDVARNSARESKVEKDRPVVGGDGGWERET